MHHPGRYAGSRMTLYGSVLPGAARIAAWAARMGKLTPEARRRLKVLAWHRAHGGAISLTARRFGLDRGTVRRWHRRLTHEGAPGLRDRSRRPHHLRHPATPWTVVEAACRVRRDHPTWSKYKITAVLGWEGTVVSPSTVGRILKRRGFIDPRVSQKKRRAVQHPRKRFPRGLVIRAPGGTLCRWTRR